MRKGIDKLAIIAGKHVRMLEEKIAEKEENRRDSWQGI